MAWPLRDETPRARRPLGLWGGALVGLLGGGWDSEGADHQAGIELLSVGVGWRYLRLPEPSARGEHAVRREAVGSTNLPQARMALVLLRP